MTTFEYKLMLLKRASKTISAIPTGASTPETKPADAGNTTTIGTTKTIAAKSPPPPPPTAEKKTIPTVKLPDQDKTDNKIPNVK